MAMKRDWFALIVFPILMSIPLGFLWWIVFTNPHWGAKLYVGLLAVPFTVMAIITVADELKRK